MKHPENWAQALTEAVLGAPGDADTALRRGAFDARSSDPALHALLEKIERHAYRVTDDDVASLTARGWSEDKVFEWAVCASVGAGMRRLEAGMQALEAYRKETVHAAR